MAGTFDIASQDSMGVLNGSSSDASISADGSLVAFNSSIAPSSQVFVKNEQTGALTLVSQSSDGTTGNDDSFAPTISSDGSSVAFESRSTNLVGGASSGDFEIYVKNLTSGGLTLVSQTSGGTIANKSSFDPALSSNGNIVAFDSSASNLGLGVAGLFSQVYVKNVSTGALTLVSQTSGGTLANSSASENSISADGNIVVFNSVATSLGSSSGTNELYSKNVSTGALTIVSQTSGGTIANATSGQGSSSADGSLVAFASLATNLVSGATSGNPEIYLKNLSTGALTLVSSTSDGAIANGISLRPVISADGKFVMFSSTATNLVAGATSGTQQVYVKDLQTGAIALLSQDQTGTPGDNSSSTNSPAERTFSADDSKMVFDTTATNLAATGGTDTVLLNTPPPTVGFTPGVNFSRHHTATLTGTVSDPSSTITNVEVFNNGTDLGAATLNGDGTWTLSGVSLPAGVQSLSAKATDAAGGTSGQTPSLYSLQTGIHGQPYSVDEEDFNAAGQLTGEYFTKKGGQVYLADTVTNPPNGDINIDYSTGSFFDTQSYYNKSDLYGPDYGLKVETLYNNDGTTSVTGFQNGQTLNSVHNDTMTGGGTQETFVFQPHFGQDIVTDFKVNGAGHDVLSLSSSQFSSIAQALAHTQVVNGNAVIHVGQQESITLDNVTTAQLQANHQDFKFHA